MSEALPLRVPLRQAIRALRTVHDVLLVTEADLAYLGQDRQAKTTSRIAQRVKKTMRRCRKSF